MVLYHPVLSRMLLHGQTWRDQDISSSGQKFELPKKSNFCPVELLSSIFFSVHIEGEELQQWQATHFKACSESGRMTLKLNFYCLPK